MPTEKYHNTSLTYLMVSEDGTTWQKLIDVVEVPDFGSAPPTLDATTLSDTSHQYINDINDTGGALEFTCNYTLEEYSKMLKYVGILKHYSVWYGAKETAGELTPDGSFGKFDFDGELALVKKGSSVGGVQQMTVSIAPKTQPELVNPITVTE